MRRLYTLLLIILFSCLQSEAKTTNWTGYGSGILGGNNTQDWLNASNWSNGVPAAGDIVQIGVTTSYTNSPILSSDASIGSLLFGVASNGNLLINAGYTLTVTGDVTIKYNNTAAATLAITGSGNLNCQGSFYVGDSTAPPTPSILEAGQVNVTTLTLSLASLNVTQNFIINTTSSTGPVLLTTYSNANNAVVNLNSGTLTVSGNIQTTNSAYVSLNQAQLLVNPAANTTAGTSSVLSFGGSVTVNSGGLIDFYGTGAGKSTTIYSSNNSSTTQSIYSTTQSGLDTSPALYQNLSITGASPKSVQSGTVTIAGDWTSSGAYIDAQSNSNTIYFQGTAQQLTDNGSHNGTGIIFNNVNFQGSGTKTITAGNFAIGSTGVLTMAGTATLTTNGLLTLMSNISGTATVAAIPVGTSISGLVKSQRFVKGSLDNLNLTKRGYRAISSPVYSYTNGGVNYFDLKYLLDSAYVSGAAGGGFNTTGTNPSLYLYREDISSSNAMFTDGNWKGISKINNTNAYDIGTQKRLTQTNIADTTINLAVGNGVLFFFRGNKSNNSSQTGDKVTAPLDYPEDVVFTQTGYLNTGTIAVQQWYSGSTNFSITSASNVNNSGVRGFAFVGNPYPSTINFEKFNRSGASSSIYGKGFPAPTDTVTKIWIYNSTTKQYDTYMQATTVSSTADTTTTVRPVGSIYTGDASNMIASGQGFFMKVTTNNRGLTFREAAKTNTQPVSTNINRIMDVPSSSNVLAFSGVPANVNKVSNLAILGLRLVKDDDNTDDAVIAFNDHTPTTYSKGDDAEDMNGNGALVSLSVISSDNVALAIKQQRLPQTGNQTTRLLVNATASGTYHLRLRNLDNLPNAYDVWLMDSFMKDSLDLKHNSNYDFSIDKSNAATYGSNRFSIVVRLNPEAMMHILSVAANKITEGAQISWRTENEGNDFTFNIEKSVDGKTFTQIGQVSSNGSGNYAYTDIIPAKGMNYYRIKVRDMILNDTSYSNTVSLKYTGAATTALENKITVYPNPATGTINIKMQASKNDDSSYIITILGTGGRVVRQLTSNSPILQTDVTGFLPGAYMVQVTKLADDKFQAQSKFVKL